MIENIGREFNQLPVGVINNFWNPMLCREDLLEYLGLYLGVSKWDMNKWSRS